MQNELKRLAGKNRGKKTKQRCKFLRSMIRAEEAAAQRAKERQSYS